MNRGLEEFLHEFVSEKNIIMNADLSRYTTFHIGGNADCMVQIENVEQLKRILRYLRETETPYYVMGNGSNLLVGDKGYHGVILKMAAPIGTIQVKDNIITAEAGALLSQVAFVAKENGLSGMEFAAGIPGSIGGAVVMNAGAYDGEMKQIVELVKVLNKEGEILELGNDTLEFSYRNSAIKNRPFIVTEVTLKLQYGEKTKINAKIEEFAEKRKEKQPLEYPSAGSTFKRPEGNFAGKLIMEAGLRGFRIGDAQISEKHCGFIVNLGKATAEDVREVMSEAQTRVKEQFGVRLEPEIIFLGEF